MNLFNALNGKEAKTIILAEITKALDNDSEFREHLTFPRLSWSWKLEMRIYPRTPEEKVVESSGEAIQVTRDENGNLVPVVPESATHTKEVLQSVLHKVDAPDALREEAGLATDAAALGGIKTARTAEVGKAAKHPTVSPGLNR